MDQVLQSEPPITEEQLHHWRVQEAFAEVLAAVSSRQPPRHRTFAHPRRKLGYAPYLNLFFMGLINPMVDSMRGLCSISRLPRVQQEVCERPVSLGSFSEMQSLLPPELLPAVFQEVFERTRSRGQPQDARLARLNVVIEDGSLWRALPRMAWAEYGVGPKGEAKGVRLHLRFHLVKDKPLKAKITPGNSCERQALRAMCVAGQTNVGDRYYGEDYQLFGDIAQANAFFVIRIKESAVLNVEEELPLTVEDRAAGVVRHCWARLGAQEDKRSIRLRVVEIKTRDQHLFLVTNLPADLAPAELIGVIYRRRWAIELFFRWIKCILGCRHFFAESFEGVTIQLYLALIASLLFQQFTGHRPSKRLMELIQFFLMGWIRAADLIRLIPETIAKGTSAKKR
jgi:hypothetical protein